MRSPTRRTLVTPRTRGPAHLLRPLEQHRLAGGVRGALQLHQRCKHGSSHECVEAGLVRERRTRRPLIPLEPLRMLYPRQRRRRPAPPPLAHAEPGPTEGHSLSGSASVSHRHFQGVRIL